LLTINKLAVIETNQTGDSSLLETALEVHSNRMMRDILALTLLTAVGFCPAAPGAEQAVRLHRDGNRVDVLIGSRPFTSFYFDSTTAKPYLYPLRSAQGTIVTRSFPMVSDIPGEDRDEPHQRAMYFAHGDINGFDFWGEAAFPHWSRHSASKFGRTVFSQLDEMRDGPDSGRLRAEFDLFTPKDKAIGSETQAYTFRGDEHMRIIDCEFTIRADRGPLRLGDTKEGTFAIRVIKALESPPGQMVNSHGAAGESAVWGKPADWVDFYGNVGGEEVGIAVFDHPENFHHPTYWHARHYGLLAANPFGLREFNHDRHQDGSTTIEAGGSLTLRYRVLIHQGDCRQAGVTEAYRKFAEGK